MRFVITILGLAALGLGGCDTIAIGAVAAGAKIVRAHDPMNSHIRTLEPGELTALIPRYLALGQPRAGVEATLHARRYARKPPDRRAPQRQETAGAEIWYRSESRFPCTYDLYIYVRFDEAGRLVSADAMQDAGDCL